MVMLSRLHGVESIEILYEGKPVPSKDTVVYLLAINGIASGIHLVGTVTESDNYEPGMGATTRIRLIPVHDARGRIMGIGGHRYG